MNNSSPETARWIALMVIGTAMNTIGIALPGLGALRFVFMAVGLLLLLVALLNLTAAARKDSDGPANE